MKVLCQAAHKAGIMTNMLILKATHIRRHQRIDKDAHFGERKTRDHPRISPQKAAAPHQHPPTFIDRSSRATPPSKDAFSNGLSTVFAYEFKKNLNTYS